jgi:hypothetical protein
MTKRKKKNNNPLILGYYVVAFIDLMGQQEHLRNIRTLPDKNDPVQFDEMVKNLKNTYGVVSSMRRFFTDSFNSFTRKPKDSYPFTPDQRKQYELLNNNPIHLQSFSDSIVIFMALSTDHVKFPVRGIWGILGSAATTFLCLLAGGHPIRGGIDVGIGMDLSKTEIYGPALSRAYTLESKIANYPRLVVGKELIAYLEGSKNQPPNDLIAQATIKMSGECLNFLTIDDDGYPIIDYLGEAFKRNLGDVVTSEIVKKAYDNVIHFSNQFQKEQNTKLAFRYTLLRNYFENRIALWKGEGECNS